MTTRQKAVILSFIGALVSSEHGAALTEIRNQYPQLVSVTVTLPRTFIIISIAIVIIDPMTTCGRRIVAQ